MDKGNINRMVRLCMGIADRADSEDAVDRAAVQKVCGCGIRIVSSTLRRGIAEIMLLMDGYEATKLNLEIANGIKKDAHETLESLFGINNPSELLYEDEMGKLKELCEPAREYINSCLHKHDEEDETNDEG